MPLPAQRHTRSLPDHGDASTGDRSQFLGGKSKHPATQTAESRRPANSLARSYRDSRRKRNLIFRQISMMEDTHPACIHSYAGTLSISFSPGGRDSNQLAGMFFNTSIELNCLLCLLPARLAHSTIFFKPSSKEYL